MERVAAASLRLLDYYEPGSSQNMGLIETTKYRVHLCCGPNCSRANSRALLPILAAEITAQGLADEISVQETSCRNRCEQAPSLNVYPGPVFYNRLTPEAIRTIVREHLRGGEPVRTWLYQSGERSRARSGVLPPSGGDGRARGGGADWRWWKGGGRE